MTVYLVDAKFIAKFFSEITPIKNLLYLLYFFIQQLSLKVFRLLLRKLNLTEIVSCGI